MTLLKVISTAFCFFLLAASGFSQKQVSDNVVQITGACLVSDSLFPAPYVSIFRTRDKRGTYSNRDGYFTLPAMEGDTLIFICTGLKTSQFIVPITDEHQIRIVQLMDIAPYEMSPLYILPYPGMDINYSKETIFHWRIMMVWRIFPMLLMKMARKYYRHDIITDLSQAEIYYLLMPGIYF